MTRGSLLAALLLLVSASAAISSTARAQQRGAAVLQAADANGDGAVSREEFLAARGQQFTRRDRNQDGSLDSTEFANRAAARPALAERMQKRLDQNGDGKISKDEFVNGGVALFERMDGDHNGSLDAKELAASAGRGGALVEDAPVTQSPIPQSPIPQSK